MSDSLSDVIVRGVEEIKQIDSIKQKFRDIDGFMLPIVNDAIEATWDACSKEYKEEITKNRAMYHYWANKWVNISAKGNLMFQTLSRIANCLDENEGPLAGFYKAYAQSTVNSVADFKEEDETENQDKSLDTEKA